MQHTFPARSITNHLEVNVPDLETFLHERLIFLHHLQLRHGHCKDTLSPTPFPGAVALTRRTAVTSAVKYAVRPSVVTTKKFKKLTDLAKLDALTDVAASLQALAKTHL